MPYKDIKDLPERVQQSLPKHAQEIYKEAYNNAWKQYKDPKKRLPGAEHEETAHKVSWAAVKKEYVKNEKGEWVKR